MKTINLKIIKENKASITDYEALTVALMDIRENGPSYSLRVCESLNDDTIYQAIADCYGLDNCTIREGVNGGCYGARDGKVYKGFTLFLDSSLFPERFIDGDYDEVINIEQLCNEYGEKLDIDADQLEDTLYKVGIEGKSDNTYNYLGHDSESPVPLCHADFTVYELNGEGVPVLISVKFHCGGDIRGNYTENVVYKFDDIYEAYNAFHPGLQLIDYENLEEVDRLKDLISRDPEDKNLLIKELKELLGV